MDYLYFQIKNFKGIKDTTINFNRFISAGIFPIVGLNESGKTTILQAIHMFSPDFLTSRLIKNSSSAKDHVPRHEIASFSSDVSIAATIQVSEEDKSDLRKNLRDVGIIVNEIPDVVVLEKYETFLNGDFVKEGFRLKTAMEFHKTNQRKWILFNELDKETQTEITDSFYDLIPDIAYFPTTVFQFPEKILLTKRSSSINYFYQAVFQSILDGLGKNFTIEKDITNRIRKPDFLTTWVNFFSLWSAEDDASKIQHIMDAASNLVTQIVFGKWNNIFHEEAKGKQVVISYHPTEGKTPEGESSSQHDIFIQFEIKDGSRRFPINDRSLGFRWFFLFMLFTQFRTFSDNPRPILFLFDEPASNLHSAAQKKLIECFPQIAESEHMMAYTTHSHYMIDPRWLEQTFIVTNRNDLKEEESLIDELSLDDESLDIKVTSYRNFVNTYPSRTSYFQPILDRLEVAPTDFELNKNSVLLEGKSDFYILKYALLLHKHENFDLSLIPAIGATTFNPLIALCVGWGVNMVCLLDGDKAGQESKKNYIKDFCLSSDRVLTLSDLDASLIQIEDLIDIEGIDVIKKCLKLDVQPNKNQIMRFFQEKLASDQITNISQSFNEKSLHILSMLNKKLKSLSLH